MHGLVMSYICCGDCTSGAVDNYSREGFKICDKFPTYAGVIVTVLP